MREGRLRRRGRPKPRWEDRLRHDIKELLLSKDMTSDRNEWRARIRLGGLDSRISEIDLLSNPSEIDAPKLMKKITDIYFTRVTKDAESISSVSPRQVALWKSQREDHTSDWLRAVPIYGLGQTMNDHAVSCAGITGIKHRRNSL
ncbi:hypothetical protein Tco_0270474 [Tanacetum coccineum]